MVWELARRSGQAIHQQADAHWLFVGRPVKLLDGTTVIMPDTQANQALYPQSRSQKPGLGFPIARFLLIISLAVGTVLEAALGPYQANNPVNWDCSVKSVVSSSPVISLWPIDSSAIPGSSRIRSVAVVDVVFRMHQTRKADFLRGRWLRSGHHIVTWPKSPRPDWMSPAEYAAMPAELRLREIRVRIKECTKRTRELVIVTTLFDATKYSTSAFQV